MRSETEILSVTSLEEAHAIKAAAEKDNHYVLAPTHYWKDSSGDITGYFSNGIIPVCHFWMRSDSNPRDSFAVVRRCEVLAAERAQAHKLPTYAMIACASKSPFYPMLEKHFGLKQIVNGTTLFGKSLKHLIKET